MLLRGVVIAGRQGDPGQHQFTADAGKPAGQLRRGAQVAERQAHKRLQLIGPGQQRRACLGQGQARRVDTGQRLAELPAGGPDPGLVQQREELNERPPRRRQVQHLLGKVLGGVEVTPLQREAGQRAQVIHGEEMLAESQPLGGGIGGSGSIGRLAQAAGLQPYQRDGTRYQHQLDRFGE